MSFLDVVLYPNTILLKATKKLNRLRRKDLMLIQDMIDTMYEKDGVGIAAPQVGVSKRCIVISPKGRVGEEQVCINPEIVEYSTDIDIGIEGCLSLPGISCEVPRARKIRFQSSDLSSATRVYELEGFPARVVQHEVDHLNGLLIIDRIKFNERQSVLSKYQRVS